jgi:hypothetical protein
MNTIHEPTVSDPDALPPPGTVPYFSAAADWLTEKLVEAWCRTAARIARAA